MTQKISLSGITITLTRSRGTIRKIRPHKAA
jgi:hypothetical protein